MNTKQMTQIAMVAAVYTVLSVALAPISYGPIQVRIAETLTLLPLIWQPSITALTLGCFLTNLIGVHLGVTGPIDILVGTLATFLAAMCTWRFREKTIKGIPVLSILMPVIFNGVFVGLELAWMLNPDNIAAMAVVYGLQVAAGELIAVIIGWLLLPMLKKAQIFGEQ